jgi:pilus assembly protein CpaF
MFAITVTEKGGEQRRLDFDKSEVTIGRVQGNDVILPKGNVSKRHARIVLKDGKFIIVDLKSTNGTYVNGRKITSPLVVKENDKIYIGDFILGVEEPGAEAQPQHQAATVQPGTPVVPLSAPPPMAPPVAAPQQSQAGMGMMQPPMPVAAPMPIPTAPPMAAPPHMPPPAPASQSHLGAGSSPMTSTPAGAEPIPREGSSARPGSKQDAGASMVSTHPRVVRSQPPISRPPSAPARSRTPVIEPIRPEMQALLAVQAEVVEHVTKKLHLEKVSAANVADEAMWKKVEKAVVDKVDELRGAGKLPDSANQERLVKDALNEALGLGPLEELMVDAEVDEIMVDRTDRVLVGKDGVFRGTHHAFSSDESLRRVVERLVAPTGESISADRPFVDVRLRDGSRLAAAVPPVAVRGACFTLRKPRTGSYNIAGLIAQGSLSGEMGDFLTTCVSARKNIVICGAPGAGKSALCAALAQAMPAGERVVSVEEVAELSLGRNEWIALESRPGDGNGKSAVDLKTLLQGALRMRPDRLVIGDLRGSEALEVVMAMSSSHDGTVACVPGDSPIEALGRMVSLSRLSAPGSSVEALQELVATAVDVVVHVVRYADNMFRVASIEEVIGLKGQGFHTQQVFLFRHGGDAPGFAAAGVVPSFYAELEARGIPADVSIFRA